MTRRAPALCVLLIASLPALVAAVGPDAPAPAPDAPPPAATAPAPAPRAAPSQPSSQNDALTPDPLPAAPDTPPAAAPKATPRPRPRPRATPRPRIAPPDAGVVPRSLPAPPPTRSVKPGTFLPRTKANPTKPLVTKRTFAPAVLPNLRVPTGQVSETPQDGQSLAVPAGPQDDNGALILIGAVGGVALAGLGVTRLARRRATVLSGSGIPAGFVFPTVAEATPPSPIAGSIAPTPYLPPAVELPEPAETGAAHRSIQTNTVTLN